MNYFVEAGSLFTVNEQGKIVWTGKPEDYPVQWASPVPGSEDILVLYVYDRPGQRQHGFPNLVRLDSSLCVLWRAELPIRDDVYVHAVSNDAGLEADSFEGYHAVIDIKTGKIINRTWTK